MYLKDIIRGGMSMKSKSIAVLLLILVLSAGILVVPEGVFAKEYKDRECIQAKEWIASLKENGMASDTYIFSKKSQGKWIPIEPQAEGILKIGCDFSVYTKDKKTVNVIRGTEDGDVFIPDVKKTDVFYIKLPDEISDPVAVKAVVKKDHVSPLETQILYTQSGQDKNVSQTFKVKKRGIQSFYIAPVCYNKKDVTFYIQRKGKEGKWETVTKTLKSIANDHEQTGFYFGLKAGEYCLVSKAAKDQIYQISRDGKSISANYKTKKSKAQKIKLKTSKTNVYTATEKASRWYRVNRKTAKYKRYIKMKVQNNSGKVKFTIYKKGRKKALKSCTLSGNQSKTYRLKDGKGTYYVKVGKSGAKMNGQYAIQYQ